MTMAAPFLGEPEVIRVLRQHRAALIAREEKQTKRLAQKWLELETSLENDMLLLALQIEEERAKESNITEQLMRRMDRYKKLDSQMKQEILSYAKDTAVPDIEAEQLEYGMSAIRSSSEAIRISMAPGYQFDRLPKDAVENYVGYLGDDTPLYRLLKEAYPDSVDSVVKSFLNDAAKGLNPLQMAMNASRALDIGLERITLIARTEQLRVNRAVSAEQYRASNLEGVMKRVATKDDRVCMACLVSDGEVISLDKELEDHPRGRCVAIFQIKQAALIDWEKGPDWFVKQDEATQRKLMGDKKYDLWQEGVFDLEDLRRTDFNQTWGSSPRVATLKELLEGKDFDMSAFVSRRPKAPRTVAPKKQGPITVDTPQGPILLEHASDIKMKGLEDRIVNQSFETAGVYTPDGKVLLVKDGEKSSVNFTKAEISLMKGNTLTHNHPGGSPFSADDVGFLNYAQLKEIRAVGSEYTYILKNNGFREYTYEESFAFMNVAAHKVQDELLKKHRDLDYKTVLHMYWKQYSKLTGQTYTRRKYARNK